MDRFLEDLIEGGYGRTLCFGCTGDAGSIEGDYVGENFICLLSVYCGYLACWVHELFHPGVLAVAVPRVSIECSRIYIFIFEVTNK